MAISGTTALAIAGGVSAASSVAGNIMGARAQDSALARAQGMVAQGMAGSAQLRQAIEEWTGVYRDYAKEQAEAINREAGAFGTRDSQTYRDANRLLSGSLAASGGIRSGAAVTARRELAASEAESAFGRRMAAANLFGQTALGGQQIQAGLVQGEMAAQGQRADMEATRGAVEGSKMAGIGGAIGDLAMGVGTGYASGLFGGAGSTAQIGGLDGGFDARIDPERFTSGLSMARR
jgi:hypothetical protein